MAKENGELSYLSQRLGFLKRAVGLFLDSVRQFENGAKLILACEMYELAASCFGSLGDRKTARRLRAHVARMH